MLFSCLRKCMNVFKQTNQHNKNTKSKIINLYLTSTSSNSTPSVLGHTQIFYQNEIRITGFKIYKNFSRLNMARISRRKMVTKVNHFYVYLFVVRTYLPFCIHSCSKTRNCTIYSFCSLRRLICEIIICIYW